MRIAIFSDNFYPCVGGTELVTYALARELAKNNEVLVGCPKFKNANYEDYPFQVISTKSIHLKGNNYLALPNFSPKFKKALTLFAPNIIHCQTGNGMTKYALQYGKKHNIPVIITLHTKFSYSFIEEIKINFIVKPILRLIGKRLQKATGVSSVSKSMIPEMSKYGYNGKVKIICNGIDTAIPENISELKEKVYQKYQLTPNENIFSMVGRIHKYKNIQFVLDSLSLLKNQGVQFKTLIAGTGPHLEHFQSQVEKLGLEECVRFIGKVSYEELQGIYAVSDLFLMTSIFDNGPLTLFEAAMYGVPSLILQECAASEVIQDNISGFISENDIEKYALKIKEIIKDKIQLKKVGEKAKKELPISWEDIAKQYFEFYKENIKVIS